MATRPKRPRDPFQLAKLIGDISTGQVQDAIVEETARVRSGRLGGIKGGAARAVALSKSQRKKIAKKAAKARWIKKPLTVD